MNLDQNQLKAHLACVLDERAVWMEHNLKPSPELEAAVQALRAELGSTPLADAADDAL